MDDENDATLQSFETIKEQLHIGNLDEVSSTTRERHIVGTTIADEEGNEDGNGVVMPSLLETSKALLHVAHGDDDSVSSSRHEPRKSDASIDNVVGIEEKDKNNNSASRQSPKTVKESTQVSSRGIDGESSQSHKSQTTYSAIDADVGDEDDNYVTPQISHATEEPMHDFDGEFGDRTVDDVSPLAGTPMNEDVDNKEEHVVTPSMLQTNKESLEVFDDEFGDGNIDGVSSPSLESHLSDALLIDAVVEEEDRSMDVDDVEWKRQLSDSPIDNFVEEKARDEDENIVPTQMPQVIKDPIQIFDDELGDVDVKGVSSPIFQSQPVDILKDEQDASPPVSKPIKVSIQTFDDKFRGGDVKNVESQLSDTPIDVVVEEEERDMDENAAVALKPQLGSEPLEILDDEYGDANGAVIEHSDQLWQDSEGLTDLIEERGVSMNIKPLYAAPVEELEAKKNRRKIRRKLVMESIGLSMNSQGSATDRNVSRADVLHEETMKTAAKKSLSKKSGLGRTNINVKVAEGARLPEKTDLERIRLYMIAARGMVTKEDRRKIVMTAIHNATQDRRGTGSKRPSPENGFRLMTRLDLIDSLRVFSIMATKKGRRDIVMKAIKAKTETPTRTVNGSCKSSGTSQRQSSDENGSPRRNHISRKTRSAQILSPKETNPNRQNSVDSKVSSRAEAPSPRRSLKARSIVESKSPKINQTKSSTEIRSPKGISPKRRKSTGSQFPGRRQRKSSADVQSPKGTSPKRTKSADSQSPSICDTRSPSICDIRSPRRSRKGRKSADGQSSKRSEVKSTADIRLPKETIPHSLSSKRSQRTSSAEIQIPGKSSKSKKSRKIKTADPRRSMSLDSKSTKKSTGTKRPKNAQENPIKL
jgi:hypothetical protein